MNIAFSQPSMPFIDALLQTLAPLNAFTRNGALRSYQRDVLLSGHFTCTCPFSGQSVSPSAHYLLPGTGVFYHFDTPQPYILMAVSLKDGFPLLCVVTTSEVIWAGKPERPDLVPLAQNLLLEKPASRVTTTLKSRITIGDPNFAHFLWNELPAFDEALRHTRNFEINLRFDPLGLMQPLLRRAGMTHCQMSAPLEGRGWSRSPTTLLGSTYCTADIKTSALSLLSLPPQAVPRNRIWLSLRDQGRTMQNQTAFLTALIEAQRARDPETEFLIDGFSMPMDITRKLYDPLRSKFAARISGAQKIIAKIAANLPEAKIIDMTGVPIRDALHAIGTCCFYVSHAGTMQHKPAWIYNLPGLQHGNRASLTPAALRWSAHMIDGAPEPLGLPLDLVEDTNICRQPLSNDRNKDYLVTDIAAAVRYVTQQISDSTQQAG